MTTHKDDEYWRKVRADQAYARRRAASRYEYVPNWEFYREPSTPPEPVKTPRPLLPIFAAICLICSLAYSLVSFFFSR